MIEAMDVVLNIISKIKGLTLDEAHHIATLIDDDRQSRLKEALIKDYRSPYFTVRVVMEFRAEEPDGDPAAIGIALQLLPTLPIERSSLPGRGDYSARRRQIARDYHSKKAHEVAGGHARSGMANALRASPQFLRCARR